MSYLVQKNIIYIYIFHITCQVNDGYLANPRKLSVSMVTIVYLIFKKKYNTSYKKEWIIKKELRKYLGKK